MKNRIIMACILLASATTQIYSTHYWYFYNATSLPYTITIDNTVVATIPANTTSANKISINADTYNGKNAILTMNNVNDIGTLETKSITKTIINSNKTFYIDPLVYITYYWSPYLKDTANTSSDYFGNPLS